MSALKELLVSLDRAASLEGGTMLNNKDLKRLIKIIRVQQEALKQYTGISCQEQSSVSQYSAAAEAIGQVETIAGEE